MTMHTEQMILNPTHQLTPGDRCWSCRTASFLSSCAVR